MKKSLIFVICILLTASFAFSLVSCNMQPQLNTGNSGDGNVPVYKGMTISSIFNSTYAGANGNGNNGNGNGNNKTEDGKEDFDYDKDNGNHNGHFKGDTTDQEEDLDQENPFPENSENDNIEEEANSSLIVDGAEQEIYYADLGEDIYVNIHIQNPESYEILSFTLNGVKYISQNGLLDKLGKILHHPYRYAPIHICDERFEIAFTHIDAPGEQIISYVNDHHTGNGGTHHDAFRKALADVLTECFNEKITQGQCCKGLVAVIKVSIQWPSFANSSKNTLASSHMWYDADDNHGPTIYETFKHALLKTMTDNKELFANLEGIWE